MNRVLNAYATTERVPNARARVNAPIPHDGGSDRRWLSEEAGADTYLGALLRMLRQPTKFAIDWTQGAKTISPLKFVAVTTTIVAVTTQLVQDGTTASTTWLTLASSVAPTLVFALLGVLIHLVYKAIGSQRSVQTSLGLTLYTIAGPGLFFPLFLVAMQWYVKHHTTEKLNTWLLHQDLRVMLTFVVVLFGLYFWPRIALGRAMHALHRRRWWWSVLAIVLAELAVAVMFGIMERAHVGYGTIFNWPRLVLSPDLRGFAIWW